MVLILTRDPLTKTWKDPVKSERPLSKEAWVRQLDWAQILVLSFTLVIIIALWNTWLLFPLRILVVFFHELSHALAAWLTGGRVVGIRIVAHEGGLCVTRGGMAFLILSAGYLGSLLWGGLLLKLASSGKRTPWAVGALGGLIIVVTVWLFRPLLQFGTVFGFLAGVALIACAWKLPATANGHILQVCGLTSCLYAILDIRGDLFGPAMHGPNDAILLAHQTGIPAVLWGVLWLGISVPVALYFLLRACRRKPGMSNIRH